LPEVVLEGLLRRYGETAAVDGIDLVIADGSFAVLLGPSGCGKSTTLRLIAGLDTATAGRIKIAGRDVTDLPPAKRGLAMVFQNYALFPHLSVAENILFGLKVRRVPAAERRRRIDRAAGILGLEQLLERKPSQLSGGQQQRVALARAIVAEAKLCLMDEPLSNLDAKLRAEMRQEIRDLQRRLEMTMIYVTHDQAEALSMADQVVLMRDGRIEQDAPPAELYGRPATAIRRELRRHAADEPLAARGRRATASSSPGPRARCWGPSGYRRRRCWSAFAPKRWCRQPRAARLDVEVVAHDYQGADTILVCRAVSRPCSRAPPAMPPSHRAAGSQLGFAAGRSRLFRRRRRAPGDPARIRLPAFAATVIEILGGVT
jgi:sn-glycerol 3-phosphate transport system ATP-binding protein